MKASKFSDAQKAFIVKRGEEGVPVAEICREAGISQATYFKCRKKYAGLMPSEMKRLRELEQENALGDFNREGQGIEVAISILALRVIRTLERIIEWRGQPVNSRVDNGPENVSAALQTWLQDVGSGWSISSPANRNRTPMSNVITELSAVSGSDNTFRNDRGGTRPHHTMAMDI